MMTLTNTDWCASWPSVILFTNSHRHPNKSKSWVTLIHNAPSIIIVLSGDLSIDYGLRCATMPSYGYASKKGKLIQWYPLWWVKNGIWKSESYLDTGPVFRSKDHWTCIHVPEIPLKCTLSYKKKLLWLHTQSEFQFCVHLVESPDLRRRWLKENKNRHFSPTGYKKSELFYGF